MQMLLTMKMCTTQTTTYRVEDTIKKTPKKGQTTEHLPVLGGGCSITLTAILEPITNCNERERDRDKGNSDLEGKIELS